MRMGAGAAAALDAIAVQPQRIQADPSAASAEKYVDRMAFSLRFCG
jgi:hypothetical protein